MKKVLLFFIAILLLPLTLTNSSCSKDCSFALCDLATEIIIQGTLSVTAGTPVAIPNLIKNIPDVVTACKGDLVETLTANASKSRIKIDYDAGNNGAYSQNVKNSQFDIGGIEAGSSVTENYNYSFNQPGVYRLITFCDDNDDNKERNENNNRSADAFGEGFRVKGEARQPLYIHVLPNPGYQRAEGEPFVTLLSRTVEYN